MLILSTWTIQLSTQHDIDTCVHENSTTVMILLKTLEHLERPARMWSLLMRGQQKVDNFLHLRLVDLQAQDEWPEVVDGVRLRKRTAQMFHLDTETVTNTYWFIYLILMCTVYKKWIQRHALG